MTDTTTSVEAAALVAEGNAALLAGDSYTARQRFRQALDLDPQRVPALIGLAGSVRPYREKLDYLRRALEIEPDNQEARAALAHVEARVAAGEVLAPGGVQVREPLPSGLAAPPPAVPTVAAPAATSLHCYIHPDRETGLRCTNCDRPICAECVRPAAVGQLCPECAKARRPVNYQVSALESSTGAAAALLYSVVVSTLGIFLFGNVGFLGFIIAFFLGPIAGDMLVRLVDKLTRNKRGRVMQIAVGVAYSVGLLFVISGLSLVLAGTLSPAVVGALFFQLPWGMYLFTVIALVTSIARLR
jgi:tetratricopeptide (TPR) repeat protein